MTSTLASLVAPLSADAFCSTYFRRRCSFGRVPDSELATLLAALSAGNVPDLLTDCEQVVVLSRSPEGVPESRTVGPNEAWGLFRDGVTLYFGVTRVEVLSWAQNLARELGLPPERVQCSIFASRAGGGLEPHFDANENFTLQLQGHKRWLVSDLRTLESPTCNSGREHRGELAQYHFEQLSGEMPADAYEVEMAPGSTLYVPQGAWHQTEASRESISLNVCLPVTSWLDDVLLPAIRATLIRHAEYRGWPVGFSSSSSAFGDPGRAELERLLERLPQDLRALTAGCLKADAGVELAIPDAVLARNPLVTLRVARHDTAGGAAVHVAHRLPLTAPRQVQVALNETELRACGALARATLPFTAEQLARSVGADESELEGLLTVLLRERAIVRLPPQLSSVK